MYVYIYLYSFVNGNSDNLSMCEYVALSESLFNNITSFTTCAEWLPVYKGTVHVLIDSLFSVIGLGNFYSKNYFDGAIELVEGVITVILIIIYMSMLFQSTRTNKVWYQCSVVDFTDILQHS